MQARAGLVFIALCIIPSIARIFESSMTGHMLVQLPLLSVAGGLLLAKGSVIYQYANRFDPKGVIALVFGSGWLLFWMLPMNLDFAASEISYRLLKLVSVPLGIGLCFRWVWMRSHLIVRIVVLFEAWAGAVRLGWLYLESPEQLCSSYLIGEQQVVGKILLSVALAAGVVGMVWGIFGKFQQVEQPQKDDRKSI